MVSKTCSRCKTTKSLDLFYKHKHAKDGMSSYCKKCHAEQRREWRHKNPEDARKQGCADQKKRRLKNPDAVREYDRIRYQNPKRRLQQQVSSKRQYSKNSEQIKHRLREGRKNDPGKYRDYDLKRTYGITRDEWNQMLADQGGRCANPGCRTTEPGGRYNEWQVDHDHTTGKVRSLLCSNCNLTLGNAKECEFRLEGLAEYLRRYRT